MQKDWDIQGLEDYFRKAKLPVSITLGDGVKIISVKKFVESHLATIRERKDTSLFEPFYERLCKLKGLLMENKS